MQEFFGVERLVKEFEILKKVLINNAVPVDLAQIQSGGLENAVQNTKGWGDRVLFDKKVFM